MGVYNLYFSFNHPVTTRPFAPVACGLRGRRHQPQRRPPRVWASRLWNGKKNAKKLDISSTSCKSSWSKHGGYKEKIEETHGFLPLNMQGVPLWHSPCNDHSLGNMWNCLRFVIRQSLQNVWCGLSSRNMILSVADIQVFNPSRKRTGPREGFPAQILIWGGSKSSFLSTHRYVSKQKCDMPVPCSQANRSESTSIGKLFEHSCFGNVFILQWLHCHWNHRLPAGCKHVIIVPSSRFSPAKKNVIHD